MVNQAFEDKHPRHGDGTFRDVDEKNMGQLPNDESTFDPEERVNTLLEERLPLNADRTGKVPTLDPDDGSVKARTELGRYLYNSLDENADREALADDTVQGLWPDATRIDTWDDEIQRHAANDESKTGSRNQVYQLADGRILLVNLPDLTVGASSILVDVAPAPFGGVVSSHWYPRVQPQYWGLTV